ncbi:MAG: WbqC family protein [Pseudomonadota bacterium]
MIDRDYRLNGTIMIHQPHFMPWVHYIARMAIADVVVFLDDVPFRKYYFHNRTYFQRSDGSLLQITLPVEAGNSRIKLATTRIASSRHKDKILETTRHFYRKAPYFSSIWNDFKDGICNDQNELCAYNVNLLKMIASTAGIRKQNIFFSSEFTKTSNASERINEICKELQLNSVLCGWGGSKAVHDLEFLKNNDVRLVSLPNKLKSPPRSVAHELFFNPEEIHKTIEFTRKQYLELLN